MKRRGPTTKTEAKLFRSGCEIVAGIDEVGRGAWAGPVAVGIALATRKSLMRFPAGVRDSKQLTPLQRDRLFDPLRGAVSAYAIGYASADECDELGMTRGQGLATRRALAELSVQPDGVILDGNHNYTEIDRAIVLPKADTLSKIVAAASILAKVTRDPLMVSYASRFPGFGFDRNKGYASLEHRQAVGKLGLTELHRKSWSFAQTFEMLPLDLPQPADTARL